MKHLGWATTYLDSAVSHVYSQKTLSLMHCDHQSGWLDGTGAEVT